MLKLAFVNYLYSYLYPTSVPRLQEGLSLSHLEAAFQCSIVTPLKILAFSKPQAKVLPLHQFYIQLFHSLVEIAPQVG
jgi:hypothetical protein